MGGGVWVEAGVGADLTKWLDPEVPAAHIGPVAEDTTGWNQIETWEPADVCAPVQG